MGIPAANNQTPPAGDYANAVAASGLNGALALSGVGVTPVFSAWGSFNVSIWGSVATTLTTTQGSANASVGSGTGITAGAAIKSVNVPPGTTWGAFSGTSGTLAFPPGSTNASVVTGTDANASFGTVAVAATVQVEKSYDGGYTWIVANIGGGGTLAQYINPQSATFVPTEPESGVLYRLNCISYSSGTISWRFSTTSPAPTSWGIAPR